MSGKTSAPSTPLNENGTFAWRLGGAYADDAIRGTGFVWDNNAEFEIDDFISQAMSLRWFYVAVPTYAGSVRHIFDLSGVWDTPVQRNLENCR